MEVDYNRLCDDISSSSASNISCLIPLEDKREKQTNTCTKNKKLGHIVDLNKINSEAEALELIEHIRLKFELSETKNAGDFQTIIQTPIFTTIKSRLPWLVGLLLFQSVSAVIMHSFEQTLDANLVVAFFIPMLVGTGGNAGNQPGVMVTRALTNGKPSAGVLKSIIGRECFISFIQACSLALVAFARVTMQFPDSIVAGYTIGLALFTVVLVSAGLGVGMSLCLNSFQIDPANAAAPIVSTLSDLLGILVLCSFTFIFLGQNNDLEDETP